MSSGSHVLTPPRLGGAVLAAVLLLSSQFPSGRASAAGGFQPAGVIADSDSSGLPLQTSAILTPAPSAGWNRSPVLVSFNVTDPNPGWHSIQIYYTMGSCTYLCYWMPVTGPITLNTEGKNVLSFYSRDDLGNHDAADQSITFKLDMTPPHTTASPAGTAAGGGNFLAPVTVTLHPTDNLSGVVKTVYQLDNGPLTNYNAPFVVSTLGGHFVRYYSTDVAGNLESLGGTGFTIVNHRTTITALTGTPNPSMLLQTVTFTATVHPQVGSGVPTGTVYFTSNGIVQSQGTLNAKGVATYSMDTLSGGTHIIGAYYQGDASFAASMSTISHTVKRAGTSVSVSGGPNPSVHGQTVTFTATVHPARFSGLAPGGMVTFKDGATTLGTAPLNDNYANDVATLSTSALTSGTHSITAAYSGDGNYVGSTSPVTIQTVKL
jgi:hypothetical protein